MIAASQPGEDFVDDVGDRRFAAEVHGSDAVACRAECCAADSCGGVVCAGSVALVGVVEDCGAGEEHGHRLATFCRRGMERFRAALLPWRRVG